MSKLKHVSPFKEFRQSWDGVTLEEYGTGELVALSCAMDRKKAFDMAFKNHFETTPPKPSTMNPIKGGWAMWSKVDQYWLLIDGDNCRADEDIGAKFGENAYATLQTDGWASLDVSGDRVHDVLERFIPLDLRRASKHFAARTSAHHMAIIILKFGKNKYRLMTPRSSAQSFLESLVHTIENTLG